MPERKPPTIGLKVLAFLMAVALWGFVGISQHHLPSNSIQISPEPTARPG